MAIYLARSIAWVPGDEDDLVQEGLIELNRAFSETTEVRNPPGFAAKVLSRKMKAYYSQGERNRPPPIPTESLWNLEENRDWVEEIISDLELETYLEELEEAKGSLPRWVMEQLLFPDHMLGKTLVLDLDALDDLFQNYGTPEPPTTPKISRVVNHRQLRETLGLTTPRWFGLLASIRAFTVDWMEARGYDLPEGLAERFSV